MAEALLQKTEENKDIICGLSDEQVNERVRQGLTNISVVPPYKTGAQIVCSNIFTYFNLLFTAFAVLLILVGSYKSLTFYPITIFNALLGIIQEFRAKKVLDKLTIVTAPKATVIRNGVEIQILTEELVQDDVVIFGAGNQICADAVVISGEARINEALLTGEATQITKTVDDKLLSGSFVTSGRCIARLEKVGVQSYASQLAIEAKKSGSVGKGEMMRSLEKLIKIISILLVPIGIALMLTSMLAIGNSFTDSVITTVAALLGMVSEGLYLLATISLVLSTLKLARQRVLTHDMKCIEALARVDVLCVDKTGTITSTDMEVNSIVPLYGYNADKLPPLNDLVADFVSQMYSDNETMRSLKKYFSGRESSAVADHITAFSPEFKYSSVTFGQNCYVLGSPEFLMKEKYETIHQAALPYLEQGKRLILFGLYSGQASGNELTEQVLPLGFVVLENAVRENAVETFKYFASQGVEIKVISGDNPLTVSLTAQKAGIENSDKYIDATTLTTTELISEAIAEYTVFGRVTPEQKRLFVKALKAQGRSVAMTGDGVNDVLALKDADCSVAMASGSDVAVQAAQLVLLDSDFSAMPSVVLEGRRVVNNIRRAGSLFLVKNIFSMLTALFSIFAVFTYPLTPTQITLINIFTIGTPGFLFALETDKSRITGKFIGGIIKNALPAGLTNFILIGTLLILQRILSFPEDQVSVIATLVVCSVGLVMLFKIAKPLNIYRLTVNILMIVGTIFTAIIFWNLVFGSVMLSMSSAFIIAVMVASSIPLIILFTQILKLFEKLYDKRKISVDKI